MKKPSPEPRALSVREKNRGILARSPRLKLAQFAAMLAALALVPATAQAATGFSSEDPALQARAAQAYADTYGVSLPEAYVRVELQDATAPLLNDMTAAIGSGYAGSWYDANDGGKLKIGVAGTVNGTNVQAASAVAAGAGVQDDVAFVPVKYSLSDLLAAQRLVDAQLQALMAADEVQTSIDVTMNTVAIKTAAITAGDDATVQAAAGATSVPVTVSHVPQPTLGWRRNSCALLTGSFSSNELFCDPPLRGGPLISANGHDCTVGFIVWSNSNGSPYVLTAGHCLAQDGGQKWQTRFANGTLHDIGYKHSYNWSSSGDYGLIGIENPTGWSIGSPGYVWVDGVPGQTSQNSFYTISSDGYASAGQVICNSSGPVLTTGFHTSCGTVQSGYHTDSDGVSGLIEVYACAVAGSSGGPYYKNNIAYGTEVAGNTNNACDQLYEPAPNEMSASGVHV